MKRLLVAHDLTAKCTDALGRAIRLAERHGAAIHLVHVDAGPAAPGETSAIHRRLETEAQIMAEEIAEHVPDISAWVVSGYPGEAIGRLAAHVGADLVLLGSHDQPRLRDILLGTTAADLAHSQNIPVLVVQRPYFTSHAKVMIALAGPDDAEHILRCAIRVAADAEMFAVHAFEPASATSPPHPREVRTILAEREAALDDLAGRALPPGSVGRCHVIAHEGEAGEILLHAWLDLDPDLLIVGATRRSGLGWLAEGGPSDTLLLACTCDVLLVPAKGGPPSGSAARL